MPTTRTGTHAHAAARWAMAVARAVSSPSDPRTLERWGHAIGCSRGTIRAWCRAAGEPPHDSLALARALRAAQQHWDPWNLFDIVDDRTMRAFLRRCGLSLTSPPPSLEVYVARQRLVAQEENRRVLLDRLSPGRQVTKRSELPVAAAARSSQ